MKKILVFLLFVAFALLCGVESGRKFLLSAQRDHDAALYSASAARKAAASEFREEPIDYRTLFDANDVSH